MTRNIWFSVLICGLFGVQGVSAQEAVSVEGEEWNTAVDFVHKSYIFTHNGLQSRVNQDSEFSDDWRDGSVDGSGWGIRVTGRRENSRARLQFVRSNYTWDWDYVRGGEPGRHEIDTDRRDLRLLWSEATGSSETAFWGWNVGFKYAGINRTIAISEKDQLWEFDTNNNWYMMMAGYFGENWLLGREYFNFHGSINFLFGEASGTARTGEDENIDGNIQDIYSDEYSLAYGLNGSVGVGFRITDRINFGLDYQREWMYSFEANEDSFVVFPDNDDALFVANNHNAYAYLGMTW
jgi:hypothetical protein